MLENEQLRAAAGAGACPVDHAFDPFASDYLADPYPFLAAARAGAPVFYAPHIDMWVVTRYADIEAIFLDPATFSASIAQAPLAPLSPEAQQVLAEGNFRPRPTMSNLDPPQHARIRQHNVKTFSARRLAGLEPAIRQKTEQLLSTFIDDGRADLVSQLTFPLPAHTIFTLIGFPPQDTEMLKRWCNNRLAITWGRPSREEQVEVAQNMVAYWHYCQEFVQRRVHERSDDFTSGLLNIRDASPTSPSSDSASQRLSTSTAQAGGKEVPSTARTESVSALNIQAGGEEVLSQEEISSIVYGLSFAGHETTTNLLANMLRQLLTHRAAWEEVCADPNCIPNVVEETLRFDTSVIAWRRITTRPTQIAGTPVPQGAKLMLLLASADHDPAVFEQPERFDIHRANAKANLAFGKGIHFCLGAPLARMQARIVLEVLSKRLPSLRLLPDQTLTFAPNISFRGPEHLWAEWDL